MGSHSTKGNRPRTCTFPNPLPQSRRHPKQHRRPPITNTPDQLFHIGVAIYSLIIVPLKVSLILQIRRIFIPHSRSLHSRPLLLWVIDSFLALNVMFYITLFLFQFLACRPLAHAWNPLVEGKCVKDSLAVHIVSAGINTVSDLIIVVLPQPIIWRLELDRQKKWGLTAVFLLGAL